MSSFHQISTTIIYCGAFLALVIAVERFVNRDRNRINFMVFFLILCNAVFTVNVAFAANGIQVMHPWLSFLFPASLYLTGPLNIMYYTALMDGNKRIPARIQWQLAPAVVVAIGEVFFHLKPLEEQRVLVSALFDPAQVNYLKVVIVLGVLSIVSYFIFLLKEALLVWDRTSVRRETLSVIVMDLVGISIALLLVAGFLAGSVMLLLSGGLIFVMHSVMIFLLHSRNPRFFYLLKKEIRDKKYQNCMLSGLDIDALHEQILALMDEGLYRDPELNLPKLADRLGITTHRLSQFLNERLNTTFHGFINNYRIEEAKQLLNSNEEHTVLSVCYGVGFNSKSTFNVVFRKITGITPTDFRRNAAKGRGQIQISNEMEESSGNNVTR